MKSSAENLANTDRTSWQRVVMVMKYFWPALRPLAVIYPLLAVAIVLLMYYRGVTDGNPVPNTLISVVAWAIVFAPCFFSRQPNGEVFYSLPALGWEKCEAIFLMMFIGVPLLFLPLDIYGLLIGKKLALSVAATTINLDMSWPLVFMSLMSALTSQCAAIWAVFSARRHRALKAFGAAVAFMFVDGIFGFIVGFLSAISSPHTTPMDIKMTGYFNIFMPYFCAFWAVAFLFVFYKATRAISRRQL